MLKFHVRFNCIQSYFSTNSRTMLFLLQSINHQLSVQWDGSMDKEACMSCWRPEFNTQVPKLPGGNWLLRVAYWFYRPTLAHALLHTCMHKIRKKKKRKEGGKEGEGKKGGKKISQFAEFSDSLWELLLFELSNFFISV